MNDPDARVRRLQEQAAAVLSRDVFDADPTATSTISELIEQLVVHQTELRIQNGELSRAQEAAAAALARYSTLFDSLPLPAFVVDVGSRVQMANPVAAGVFGQHSPADVIGRKLATRFDGPSRTALMRALEGQVNAPVRLPDIRLLPSHTSPADDERRPHDVHLLALSGSPGADRRCLVLLVDRSADAERARRAQLTAALLDLRRCAEDGSRSRLAVAALRNLEEITGSSRCAWFVLEAGGAPDLLSWSRTAARADLTVDAVLRAVGEEARGSHSPRVPDQPRRRPGAVPAMRDEVGTAGGVGIHCIAAGPAGRRVVAVVTSARGARMAVGVREDVVALGDELALLLDRQKGQRDLARLSQALEQSADGVVITDRAGVISYVNASFTRLCGLHPDRAVGTALVDLFGGGESPLGDAWTTLEARGSWQGELASPDAGGTGAPLHVTLSALRDRRDRVEQYVGWLVDLSERRQAQQQIHQLAYFDALTGLPNRRFLGYRIQQAIASFSRSHVRSVVLFIDLDDFKHVNDSLGHDLGDLFLCAVAERIGHCVRDVDTVARLGGDEFVVLLPDISPTSPGACAAAEAVAERIVEEMSKPVELHGFTVSTTPSIGIAVVDASTPSADHLLRHADLAMYQAKAAGRNTVRFFDPSMQAQADSRTTLTAALRRALDDGELDLHLQPQIDVDRRVVGMEALLRWPHPTRGLVPPSTFIPLAEETGLIRAVGDWVLTRACQTLASWRTQPDKADLTVAVNVSARQFRATDMATRVRDVLAATGAPADRLELELTESVFLHDVDEAVATLAAMRELGVRIALDDFGTGYSSLAYLRRLPLSKVKIDQRFVAGVPHNGADREIVRAIIAMVHALGLPVLAEGVETEEQQLFLTEGGCDYFQGFLHGRPAPRS